MSGPGPRRFRHRPYTLPFGCCGPPTHASRGPLGYPRMSPLYSIGLGRSDSRGDPPGAGFPRYCALPRMGVLNEETHGPRRWFGKGGGPLLPVGPAAGPALACFLQGRAPSPRTEHREACTPNFGEAEVCLGGDGLVSGAGRSRRVGGAFVTAAIRTVSRGGVRMRLRNPIPVASPLKLRVRTPEAKITAVGTVIYSRR